MLLVPWLIFILIIEINGDCGGRDQGKEIVEVLIWSGGSWAGFTHGDHFGTPNYLGHEVDKRKWNCPVDCRFTVDKRRVGNVDGVIYEAQPITSYYDDYRWNPPNFPQKFTGQLWFNHGYETQYYFHLYGDPGYMDYIDGNFTYYLHSQVPITFTCLWGGGNDITDFLKPPPPKTKDKCVVFMTTNCQSGGAVHRTAYATELMKHIDVHSYGKCLHNTDFPPDMQFPIYQDHGASMRNKIEIFKKYKFVLVFENNNVTDYVTEKLPNVLQSGAVPVYMGTHNVHPYWTPGEHSIVRTDDFDGPADLAKYLKKQCDDDKEYAKFFEWKKKGISKHFEQRFNDCAFYGAECRLCQYILEQRNNITEKQREKVEERRRASHSYWISRFNGDNQFYSVDSPSTNSSLDLKHTFTISSWISTQKLDTIVLERQGLYRVELISHSNHNQAFVRLCVKQECFTSSFAVNKRWQHFVIIYDYQEDGAGSVQFWINGQKDPTIEIPTKPILDSDYQKNSPFYIGASRFVGDIDDVSIWNIAVDSKRAKSLIYDVLGGWEPGLAAYWPFNNEPREKDIVSGLELKNNGNVEFIEGVTKPLVTVSPFL